MIKQTVTYTEFDGEEITKDLFFNISQAELVKMQFDYAGGLSEHLQTVGASNDGKLIMQTFTDLIKAAYGQKSEDGKRFAKSEEIWQDFVSSEAYSAFFMQLVTTPDLQVEFIKGIIPAGLAEDAALVVAANADAAAQVDTPPAGPRILTRMEAISMTDAELQAGLVSGEFVLGPPTP